MSLEEATAKIIMSLRAAGIREKEILETIENFLPLLLTKNINEGKSCYNIGDIVDIAKLISVSASNKLNRTSILTIGNVRGWLAIILSRFYRRVYCICYDDTSLRRIKLNLKNFKIQNIFLKSDKTRKNWEEVSPFDSIICLKLLNKFPNELISQLSESAELTMLNEDYKDNTNEIVVIKKDCSAFKTGIFVNNLVLNQLI